jgi:hypothetical protein
MIPAEKAVQIDDIFGGLVALGCQRAKAADGIRDGIVLKRVFKNQSLEAQEYCLAAGGLVAEGWLNMVLVQGQIKGFIRAFPKEAAAAPKANLLQFPQGRSRKGTAQATPGAVVPLRRR